MTSTDLTISSSDTTDQAGRFRVAGFGNGQAYARVRDGFEGIYQPQIYDGMPCPEPCDITAGDPIPTVVGATSTGVDFHLDRLGGISGTLTDELSGEPIPGTVEVASVNGGATRFGFADIDGRYTVGGLEPGQYTVFTNFSSRYENELYDDIPCPGFCDAVGGTPVAVSLDQVTEGIDFALRPLGSISGTVVDDVSLEGVDGGSVILWSSAGNVITNDLTNADGSFLLRDLRQGTYYLTSVAFGYEYELYDDLPCPGGPPSGCMPTAGTPVVVSSGSNTAVAIDLSRLASLEGTVSDAGSGDAIDGAFVRVWDSSGQFVESDFTDELGAYRIEGLAAGSYFVTARSFAHVDELFDDRACPGGPPTGCDVTTGDPVELSNAEMATGIDFQLAPRGSLSGTMESLSGEPFFFASVALYDSLGNLRVTTSLNADMSFRFVGLDGGDYFLVGSASDHDTQLYDGLPCQQQTCDPTAGTPVSVIFGQETTGITLTLEPAGGLAGQVVSTDGQLLFFIAVQVFGPAGSSVEFGRTDSMGRYEFPDLDSGSYFVVAGGFNGFHAEVFDDLPCPEPCDPTTGTSVNVSSGVVTEGIDFDLVPTDGMFGQVVDSETLEPMVGVAVDLWNADGLLRTSSVTGPNGFYSFRPGETGSYFVSTDNGQGATDEVYQDLSCPLGPAFDGLCDPTAGTALDFVVGSAITGIDFELSRDVIFIDDFESGSVSAWSTSVP